MLGTLRVAALLNYLFARSESATEMHGDTA
jgi:hypothetical protein